MPQYKTISLNLQPSSNPKFACPIFFIALGEKVDWQMNSDGSAFRQTSCGHKRLCEILTERLFHTDIPK
jgi:hypothetical protein